MKSSSPQGCEPHTKMAKSLRPPRLARWVALVVGTLCSVSATKTADIISAGRLPFHFHSSWLAPMPNLVRSSLVPGGCAFVNSAARMPVGSRPSFHLASASAAFVPPGQRVGRSITAGKAAMSMSGKDGGDRKRTRSSPKSAEGSEGVAKKKNPPQPPHPAAGYDGIIAVHKPTNWTSFDVVAKVRGSVGKYIREQNPGVPHKQCRVKVGHGGTLDPAATGVLVIGIGKGTKAMDLYTKGSKSYRAVGLLGHETDTGDAEGVKVGEEMDHSHVTQEMLEGALRKFVGDIMQVPPQYSAIKKDGKKMYELARAGVEVKMEPRAVTIHSITLSRPFSETAPAFEFEVSCGGGTYIRSLVRDIAREMGTAGHMSDLVRTKQGEFVLDDCIAADDIFSADKILAAMPGKLGEVGAGVAAAGAEKEAKATE